MPLDSRLRGNDEKYQGMEFNDLNCFSRITCDARSVT